MSTLEQAIRYHQQGQLDQAESIYRRLLQANAHDSEATHLLGLLQAQQGDLAAGETLLKQAVGLAPDQPLYRFNHALVLAEMEQWQAALAELQAVLEISPRYPDAHFQAGMMCLELDKPQDAQVFLALALAENANDHRVVLALAKSHERGGNLTAALAHCDHTLSLMPDDAEALALRDRLKAATRSASAQLMGPDGSGVLTLDLAVAGIYLGEDPPMTALLPLLSEGQTTRRADANFAFASAYFQRRKPGDLDKASIYIHRAWLLSGFSERIYPLYIGVHRALGNTQRVQEASKRLGIAHLEAGRIAEALPLLHEAQYAYATHAQLDHVEFDFDMIAAVIRCTAPLRLPQRAIAPVEGRRIKLGYLMFGVTQTNSIIVKNTLVFARHHDRSRFDVAFYIPEQLTAIRRSTQGEATLATLAQLNCKAVLAPEDGDEAASLYRLAQRIHDDGVDILIDMAALADYQRLFLTCLKPAPLIAGFVQGPPQQFTPPTLDFCIAGTRHPLMDALADCEPVEGNYDLPDLSAVSPYPREQFGIPPQAFLLAASGRHVKFQGREFWEAVSGWLAANDSFHFIAIGLEQSQAPSAAQAAPDDVQQRIHYTGWRTDCLPIIVMADVVIDTYPTGGGYALAEAMALGIPVLLFRNDYSKCFDPMTWSPMEEYVAIPELLLDRGDFEQAGRLVAKLAADAEYRRRLGQRCQAAIRAKGNPANLVRQCEEIYQRRVAERATSPDNIGLSNAMRSNLSYWQQIQEDDYFEHHPCYGGLRAFDNDEKIVQRYLSLSTDMSMVEIGCGYGRDVLRFSPLVKHVYGIDVSHKILDKARGFLAEHGVRNFTPVLAENWEQNIPDGIDLVWTIVVFQHLTKDLVRNYIFGLTEKLSARGCFVCQFCEDSMGTHDADLRKYEPSVRWTREEIEALVEEAGLTLFTLDSEQATPTCIWHWAYFGKGQAAQADDHGALDRIQPAPSGTAASKKSSSDGRPTFSVLVPTYNQAHFLPTALDSLIAQTYPDWEAVVVNDGSTDDTARILESYATRDPRFRVFNKANGGTASALNEALRNTRGEWICWLSTDDYFEADKLAVHQAAFRQYPGILFFHTGYNVQDDFNGRKYPAQVDFKELVPHPELQLIRLFDLNYINGISIAIHHSVFDRLGEFTRRYRHGQDFDMWLRISAHYPTVYLEQKTCTTHIYAEQATHRSMMTGIVDSAVACLEFINDNDFPALFPFSDLLQPEQARMAIESVFVCLLKPSSYLRQCGFAVPLVERLAEWLRQVDDAQLQAYCSRLVSVYVVENPIWPMPAKLKTALLDLRRPQPVAYRRRDPLGLLEEHLQDLASGADSGDAEALEQYLAAEKKRVAVGGIFEPSPAPEAGPVSADTAGQGLRPPLNILFVVHNFLPRNYGGVEVYTYRLAQRLRSLGHEVSVFYGLYQPEQNVMRLEESHLDGLRVFTLVHGFADGLELQISHADIESAFAQFLAAGEFDVVHFQHLMNLPLLLLATAKNAGAAVCVTLHDSYLLCQRLHCHIPGEITNCSGPDSGEKCARCLTIGNNALFSDDELQRVAEGIEIRNKVAHNLLLESADLITAPSQFIASQFFRYGVPADRIAVAPLGIEPVPGGHRTAANGEIVFGYLGSIQEVKNPALLVEAFKAVAGTAALRIYGDGSVSDVGALLDSISADERISYHGAYQPGQLAQILSSIDVVVQPSLVESYGLVVREAMSAGVPVIASRAGALPEAVVHLQNGLLFESGNGAELQAWLQYCVDRPERIDALRQGIVAPLTIAGDAAQWEQRYGALRRQPAEQAAEPQAGDFDATLPALLAQSRELIDQSRLEEALAALQPALQAYPENPDILVQLARLALVAGMADEAREFLKEAAMQSIEGTQKVHELGSALLREGRMEEAKLVLDLLKQRMPPR